MTEKEVNLFKDGVPYFLKFYFIYLWIWTNCFYEEIILILCSLSHMLPILLPLCALYQIITFWPSCFPLLVGVTQQEPVEPVVEGEENEAVLLVSCRFITHIRHIRHCWLCNKYTAWRNIYTICTKCSRYPRNDTKCWRKCTFTP